MTSGREIITFQFGHFSNFIGSHWWNIQESGFQYGSGAPSEINHDVLYREGLTNQGMVTFTPRLLLVDLKGSLNSLLKTGELYDSPPVPSPSLTEWPQEKVNVVQNPKIPKNQFQQELDTGQAMSGDGPEVRNLEEEFTVWSDYLRTRYHPRTVSVINEYQHESETAPFDIYSYGSSLWKTEPFQDGFTDLIRNYAEECDNMQGFHVLLDGTDGFAGLAADAIQHLCDEYPSKSILSFPSIRSAFPNAAPLKDYIRTINLTLAFQSLAEHSSLFVPLCTGSSGWHQPGPPRRFSHVSYNEQSPFHSSALLAAALETMTLRYRLHSEGSLGDVTNSLGFLGRKAAAASLGLPFAMQHDTFLFDTLEKWEGPLWQSITPSCTLEEDHMWVQSVCLRGIPHSKLRSAESSEKARLHVHNPAYRCATRQEMLRLFLHFNCYSTVSHVTVADTPVKVTTPFPQVLSKNVGVNGLIHREERPEHSAVNSVPAIAGLHSCRGLGDMLELLHTKAKKIPFKKCQQFLDAGLEGDEYHECLHHIASLRECYFESFD